MESAADDVIKQLQLSAPGASGALPVPLSGSEKASQAKNKGTLPQGLGSWLRVLAVRSLGLFLLSLSPYALPRLVGAQPTGHAYREQNCRTVQGVESVVSTAADPVAALMRTMDTMDQAMSRVQMSGNPDSDFAAMMIPHHRGAIEMARIELQFGTDPRMRRLAQEILITQQSEIDVMQQVLDRHPVLPPARTCQKYPE